MGGEAATSSQKPSALTETPAPARRGILRPTTDVRQTKVISGDDKVSPDPSVADIQEILELMNGRSVLHCHCCNFATRQFSVRISI